MIIIIPQLNEYSLFIGVRCWMGATPKIREIFGCWSSWKRIIVPYRLPFRRQLRLRGSNFAPFVRALEVNWLGERSKSTCFQECFFITKHISRSFLACHEFGFLPPRHFMALFVILGRSNITEPLWGGRWRRGCRSLIYGILRYLVQFKKKYNNFSLN